MHICTNACLCALTCMYSMYVCMYVCMHISMQLLITISMRTSQKHSRVLLQRCPHVLHTHAHSTCVHSTTLFGLGRVEDRSNERLFKNSLSAYLIRRKDHTALKYKPALFLRSASTQVLKRNFQSQLFLRQIQTDASEATIDR